MAYSKSNREAFRVVIRDAQRQFQLTRTEKGRSYMLNLIIKYKRMLKEPVK